MSSLLADPKAQRIELIRGRHAYIELERDNVRQSIRKWVEDRLDHTEWLRTGRAQKKLLPIELRRLDLDVCSNFKAFFMRIEKLIEAVQEHYQLHWTQGDGGKCGGYHVKLLDVTRKHATLGKVLCFEDLDNLRRIRNCEKRTDYTYEAGLPTELASLLEDFTWDDGVLMRVLAQLGDAVLLVYRGMEAVGDAQCKRAEGWYARSGLGTFDSIDDLPEDDFNTYTDYGPDDELSDYDMDDVASGISDPDGVDDTMIWCEEEAPPAEKAISTAPSTAARSSSAVSNSDGTTYHSANSAGSSGSSATSAGAVEPDRKPSAVDGFGVSEEEWEEMSDVSEGSSLYLDDDFSDPRDGGTWISWDEFNSA